MVTPQGIGHVFLPAGKPLDPASFAFAQSGIRFSVIRNLSTTFGDSQIPGDPTGNRTLIDGMRIRRPEPLDDGAVATSPHILAEKSTFSKFSCY